MQLASVCVCVHVVWGPVLSCCVFCQCLCEWAGIHGTTCLIFQGRGHCQGILFLWAWFMHSCLCVCGACCVRQQLNSGVCMNVCLVFRMCAYMRPRAAFLCVRVCTLQLRGNVCVYVSCATIRECVCIHSLAMCVMQGRPTWGTLQCVRVYVDAFEFTCVCNANLYAYASCV